MPMNTTPFPPDLAYCIKVAAAFYDISPSAYVRTMVQRAIDDLADHNPLLREVFSHKH
jgi:hypothetical protein